MPLFEAVSDDVKPGRKTSMFSFLKGHQYPEATGSNRSGLTLTASGGIVSCHSLGKYEVLLASSWYRPGVEHKQNEKHIQQVPRKLSLGEVAFEWTMQTLSNRGVEKRHSKDRYE